MNWKLEPLGSICDVRDGTHDSPKYVEEGYPLLTSKNFSSGRIDFSKAQNISTNDYEKINKRSKVDVGDIIMPMIGTIGSPVVVEKEPNFAIKNVALIKFPNKNINAKYIKLVLESPLLKRNIFAKSRGGTQKFLSLGELRSLAVPLPPLAEQKRIAGILDAAEEFRQKRQRSLELLNELKQANFIDMFGDPISNNKAWPLEKLKNLTSKIGSGATPQGGNKSYKDEGVPLIRSMNVRDGLFTSKGLAYIDGEQAKALNNVQVMASDVLLNITGASVARVPTRQGKQETQCKAQLRYSLKTTYQSYS